MADSPGPKFVVENDSFLRLIQVVLDPSAPTERIEAFAHFCKHDTPDFAGWCDGIRARAQNIFPSDVHLVDSQAELLANVSGSSVIVVEELNVGAKEIAASGGGQTFNGDGGKSGFLTRPAGNAVNLEDQMMKVSANQMDYAAATSLYSRSLGLLKTAIGKR